MALAKLKKEHADNKKLHIAFGKGGNGLHLGQREDLDELAIIALESKDRSLLALFETPLPDIKELKKAKTDSQLPKAEAAPTAPKPATAATPTAPQQAAPAAPTGAPTTPAK